jgi:hypothetical protein
MLSKYFSIYLEATRRALAHSDESKMYEVLDPSYFVSQREAEFLDQHEDMAYEVETRFFDDLGIYLDAVDHGFSYVDGVPLKSLRSSIDAQINHLSRKYPAQ